MNRAIWAVVVIASMSTATAGQSHDDLIWKPPRILKTHAFPKATVPREMVRRFKVSDLTVLLERTEMKTVQAWFGGTLGDEGDAGNFLEWLCLRGSDAAGPWVLWLKSGEMDAGTVGSFQWRRVPNDAKFDKRCGVLPRTEQRIALPIDVHLGMSEAELFRVLGQPTARYESTLLYVHEHGGFSHGEEFTALNTLSVILRDGEVWAIEVLKVSMS